MPDLDRLLRVDVLLADFLRKHEGPITPRTYDGYTILPHKPETVTGRYISHIAWPRYVMWAMWLRHRIPTMASMRITANRLRGQAFWRLAYMAHQEGKPLPVRDDVHVPDWALTNPDPAPNRTSFPTITRADDNLPDVADWWATFGSLPEESVDDFRRVTQDMRDFNILQGLRDVTASLEFDDWVNNEVLSDLQILQFLETQWNGQASLWAGQEMLSEAGIAGNFELTDPHMMDFLRYQAGVSVTNIDETTRQQLAQTLWEGLSANDGNGMDMAKLGKVVQEAMTKYGNDLANMSDRRAMMIAQTETARAQTFGQFLSMLGTGVQYKIWVIAAGACLICEGQAEMGPIPIRDQFPNGLLAPPGHPVCRCQVAPAVGGFGRDSAFNPDDWAYAPDPAFLENLFKDPSFALWPRQVMDLNIPEGLAPRPLQERPAALGIINFGDLPLALQQVLTQDAFQGDALVNDVAERLAQAAQNLANIIAEDAGVAPPQTQEELQAEAEAFKDVLNEAGLITLDMLLNMDASMSEPEQQAQQGINGAIQSWLDDSGLGDTGDTGL